MYKSVHWCIQRHYIAIPCLFYCLCVKNTEYISHYCWMNVFSGRLFLKMYLTVWKKKSKWLVRVNFWFWVISKHQYDQGFYPINLHFSSGFRSLWYQLHVNTYKYQKGHKSIYYTRYICRITLRLLYTRFISSKYSNLFQTSVYLVISIVFIIQDFSN